MLWSPGSVRTSKYGQRWAVSSAVAPVIAHRAATAARHPRCHPATNANAPSAAADAVIGWTSRISP